MEIVSVMMEVSRIQLQKSAYHVTQLVRLAMAVDQQIVCLALGFVRRGIFKVKYVTAVMVTIKTPMEIAEPAITVVLCVMAHYRTNVLHVQEAIGSK
jgi:hypothetical protein